MAGAQIREILLDEIQKEVFGPRQIDETFENIEHPKSRYLSGVIYPIQTPDLAEDEMYADQTKSVADGEEDDKDESVPISVGTKPSSMGLICKVTPSQKFVQVEISYGRYLTDPNIPGKKGDGKDDANKNNEKNNNVNESDGSSKPAKKYPDWTRVEHKSEPFEIDLSKPEDRIELEPNIYFRYFANKGKESTTLTVFLTNEAEIKTGEYIEDQNCIFQPKLRLTSPDLGKIFLNISKATDKKIKESNSRDLITLFLFRKFKHFAQGRNCAAEWDLDENDDKASWIQTTFVPHYTVPEIKPKTPSAEIKKSLSMKTLSEVTDYKNYLGMLLPIADDYEKWIVGLEEERESWENDKSNKYFETKFISNQGNIPKELTEDGRKALERIKLGIDKISSDPVIGESFRFANEVMHQNILHSKWAKSNKEKISKDEPITESNPYFESFEPEWRLFQLAYLLLNIESITNPTSEDRTNVDLLWFPTGGGKTEAYYGIIAFTLAHRRMRGRDPKSREDELDRYGVSVIMRYTYRLLTLQQFQRAATLFCACEYVRLKNPKNRENFGKQPFLVGLWVGYNITPNSFYDAKKQIKKKRSTPNMVMKKTDPIQLLNCPWCGRKLDAHNYEFEQPYDSLEQLCPKRIQIKCNKKCFFGKPRDSERVLPVVFVDEDIRNLRPSLIIATVDKFAQISWNWRYSTLFGNVSQYCREHGYKPGNAPATNTEDRCDHAKKVKFSDGSMHEIKAIDIRRKLAPPELIIQDEIHLITGPLGTLTGLYETAIDILCTNEKTKLGPKIIASTATTKKSEDQLKNLFNSKSTKIFPSQGFQFGDSYFAEVLKLDGDHPGKLHVGICSTSISGFNVDSRIAACVLRKIRHIRENKNKFSFDGKTLSFSDEDLDPYYTLVGYYNTIKSLGAAVRMYEDTIPNYMRTISNISEDKFQQQNNAPKIHVDILKKEELTGRIDPAKISTKLQNIETKIGDDKVLDALLCTNMLSVGVDVERLNAMIINGQPKSVAEYIQASGRIGRKEPGIIITNYAYVRPRDLSYFENFVQFHSTYHKSVEPGTLTPFSTRARDRGLAGIFMALIRMSSKELSDNPEVFVSNEPHIEALIKGIKKKIVARVDEIDKSESERTGRDIDNLVEKWDMVRTLLKSKSSEKIKGLKYRKSPFKNEIRDEVLYLLNSSRDLYDERSIMIPESLREAESEIELYYPKHMERTDNGENRLD